jgi:GMP synthase (glutamine-hydrolysing)
MHDKILIVDFGSQVTQLIARRVREEKVYSEIVPFQKAEEAFRTMKPKAVILSGGPASVLDANAPLAPKAIYEAGVPVLGICYGEQAMARSRPAITANSAAPKSRSSPTARSSKASGRRGRNIRSG